MMNIVIIDGNTLNPGDLSWIGLKDLGNLEIYGQSTRVEGLERLKTADVVVTNKFVIDESLIKQLPNLKCICVTATGYNIIDVEACNNQNIIVCNASGYSTASTAQHAVALLLELSNQCGDYHESVGRNEWTKSNSWTYTRKPTIELAGLTLGIIGLGDIGKRVAQISQALGMKIIANKRSQSSGYIDGIKMVSRDELYKAADIISLHCPLNKSSQQMINAGSLSQMKSSAFIVNTARGGLINEIDLKHALEEGIIAGAALDVLQDEPPMLDNPLIGTPNCIITPHVAWGSKASRNRLLNTTIENIRAFIEGRTINCVN